MIAWDARLLSESQHLTLMITGLHGVYPILDPEGHLDPQVIKDLEARESDLQFHVRLTSRYKPSRDTLEEILKTHWESYDPQLADDLRLAEALQDEEYFQGSQPYQGADPYAPLPNARELVSTQQSEHITSESISDPPNADADAVTTTEETALQDDVKPDRSFDFILGNCLEDMLQKRFLRALQLRLLFQIGWAAADLLIDRAGDDHPELIYLSMKEVSMIPTLKTPTQIYV